MVAGLLGDHARAATQQYFDTNGVAAGYGVVSGGTYSWEDMNWATATGGTTATGNFVQDGSGFARFPGGASGNTYTVTVSQSEPMAGLYELVSGVTLNINQAASTSGNLNVTAGLQGFLITGASSTVVINAPLVGSGGVVQQTTGALSLFGNNSFSGGTQTTGGQVLNYNNNNSFGTGSITFTGTGGQGFVKSGTTTALTIPNPIVFGSTTTSATNFVSGSSGVTFTGDVTLPTGTATTTTTIQSGGGASVTRFTGVISGPSNLTISPPSATGGTVVLSGANTYTGNTTVTGTATTTTTLKLGASNTIASTPMLVLSGGKLDPGGFAQSMTSTLLSVINATAPSTIDYISGAAEVDFADSSAQTWVGTLNLANWDYTIDKLRFGTSATGLTSDQLARIQFNGGALGTASLDANGFVVPEPSTAALLMGGSLLLGRRRRRR